MKTLLFVRTENNSVFDGSVKGTSLKVNGDIAFTNVENQFELKKGFIELGPMPELNNAGEFTLEAVITPNQVLGSRQNIMESEDPPASFFIDEAGFLTSSVNIETVGWQLVKSNARITACKEQHVRFSRDAAGNMNLEVDGVNVGNSQFPGTMSAVGQQSFKVGTGIDGSSFQFTGKISNIQVIKGALTADIWNKRIADARFLEESIKTKIGIDTPVKVFPGLDESEARLQPIKDIMNSAGVEKISDLATLRITVPTVITKGKVLIAGRKSDTLTIDWGALVNKYKQMTTSEKQVHLATYMTNRNSTSVLNTAKSEIESSIPTNGHGDGNGISVINPNTLPDTSDPSTINPVTIESGPTDTSTVNPGTIDSGPTDTSTINPGTISAGTMGPIMVNPVTINSGMVSPNNFTPNTMNTIHRTGIMMRRDVITNTPIIESKRNSNSIADMVRIKAPELTLVNKEVFLKNLDAKSPALWPNLSDTSKNIFLKILPINTSVIIAGTLDLTNTQLLVEPDVEKLYIIAETVICGPNAKITWRRPGGSTPNRLDDPGLDGRGWSGVQQKENSLDGLDGENGRPGTSGINGANGRNAPALEMWVKNMTNVPSIDINGEDAIIGGRGQKGGRGGNGADGHVGHRWWLVDWHCDTDPGDGGDGGNGGRGGDGGKGGNGGNGGSISIGVLDGTLAGTVTAGQFQWKNQGGQRGNGGLGGAGGAGGQGGRSGIGETCTDASDGHPGAQGQPGDAGAVGSSMGVDATNNFFQFTEDAWDEFLTRPFLTEITPVDVFPGNTITIRGSRFAHNDRVVIDGATLTPVINADESISVAVPLNITGGIKSVFLKRALDGTESNRVPIHIKPQLDNLPAALPPSTNVTITGKAFLAGASVLIDGNAIPGTVNPAGNQIAFTMVGTGGTGSSGGAVTVAVRNPDGFVSNSRTATRPRILEIPFTYGIHDLSFPNFDKGVPSWGTYQDTFGAAEVWHEQLDPIFGHPILTAAYFVFYEYFLLGKGNGGLATGFCTSLSSLVADKLWKGEIDARGITLESVQTMLTAVHGKLLSRESLLHFHDQGREGNARVEITARQIERTFMTGCDRNVAPLLFFIPAGEVWDSGYFDKLSSSHCIMPYRFVYPDGHPGPQLSADGSTTISSLDGVQLFCWDCNKPNSNNCRLEFTLTGGELNFAYKPDRNTAEFDSSQGITLGHWTNGDYLLADHDLPFSGPFGLTGFIIDFLLSPADLEITDENGLRVGTFNNQIFSEMPDSHPCYLVKGAYLLPVGRNLTRRIVGNGAGAYTFNSIMPDGTTLKLENVATEIGHVDTLMVNSDASQMRFAPHIDKDFTITFSKLVGNQVRSLAINGVGGGPGTEIDVTIAPDLSLFRLGNRSVSKNISVQAFAIDKAANTPVHKNASVALPTNNDLIVTVADWNTVDLSAEALPFQ